MSEEIQQATERLRNVLQGMAEKLCEQCRAILETEIEEAHSKALKDSEAEPCEDAISRKAVIYGLSIIAKAKARSDAQKSLMGRSMFFVEHMPSVQPIGVWIPVSDRLPDNDDMMLVTCRTKKDVSSVNRAYYSRGSWHGSGSMSGVIAWMPMPDPYGGEANDET